MDEPFYNNFKIENNRVFIDEKKVKAVKNLDIKKGKGNLVEVTLTFDAVPKDLNIFGY